MPASNFSPINRAITDDIKRQLRLKGHYDLGNLEKSINELFIEEKGALHLTATSLEYMTDLEVGVEAKDIDEKKINLIKLAGWVSRKISNRGSIGIAKAIIKNWKKHGKPAHDTSGLLSVEVTFQGNENRYNGMIDTVMITDFDNEVLNTKSGRI